MGCLEISIQLDNLGMFGDINQPNNRIQSFFHAPEEVTDGNMKEICSKQHITNCYSNFSLMGIAN